MTRKAVIIGSLLLTSGLILTACGAGNGGGTGNSAADGREVAAAADVESCDASESGIRVHFNDLAKEPMEVAVAAMNERFPDLEIDAEPVPSTGYEDLTQQIVADIAVGNRPDMIMTGLGQMQFWIDTYEPVPFDESLLPDAYQTQFLGAGTDASGNIYVAPAQISAPVFAVNQALLDEAGAGNAEDIRTHEDLLDVAQKVSDHTGKPAVSIPPSGLPEWFTQGLLQASGAKLANEDGTAAFNTPEGIEALDFYSELARRGLEAGIADTSATVDAFNSGSLPIAMITTSNIVGIETGLDDSVDWMPIKLPSVDGNIDRPMPAGGNGYMILSDDECRAAFSRELMGELFTKDVVLEASGTRRSYIPVNAEARDELMTSPGASEPMKFAWSFDSELNQWGENVPGGPANEIYDAIETMLQRLQTGEDTEEVLNDAADQINALVEGAR